MSIKEAVLAFVDAIMDFTVAEHEKECDKDKCSPAAPCAFCRVNDKMMAEVKKLDE